MLYVSVWDILCKSGSRTDDTFGIIDLLQCRGKEDSVFDQAHYYMIYIAAGLLVLSAPKTSEDDNAGVRS